MAYNVKRTEHSGGKKGGGHWGKRAEAKQQSSHERRVQKNKQISEELKDADLEPEGHRPPGA